MTVWDRLDALRPNREKLPDALPRLSYQLIKFLDETVPQAQWPSGVDSIMQLANPARLYAVIWQAAQRALVDNLVARVMEEIDWYDQVEGLDHAAADDADGPPEPDRDIRLGAPPVPVD